MHLITEYMALSGHLFSVASIGESHNANVVQKVYHVSRFRMCTMLMSEWIPAQGTLILSWRVIPPALKLSALELYVITRIEQIHIHSTVVWTLYIPVVFCQYNIVTFKQLSSNFCVNYTVVFGSTMI